MSHTSFADESLHLTTLRNHDVLKRLSLRVRNGPGILNFGDNIHTFNDMAENDMLAIEMGRAVLCGDDKELAAVCLHIVSRVSVVFLVRLAFGPLLAMDSSPGLSCFSVKFSSANFSVP